MGLPPYFHNVKPMRHHKARRRRGKHRRIKRKTEQGRQETVTEFVFTL